MQKWFIDKNNHHHHQYCLCSCCLCPKFYNINFSIMLCHSQVWVRPTAFNNIQTDEQRERERERLLMYSRPPMPFESQKWKGHFQVDLNNLYGASHMTAMKVNILWMQDVQKNSFSTWQLWFRFMCCFRVHASDIQCISYYVIFASNWYIGFPLNAIAGRSPARKCRGPLIMRILKIKTEGRSLSTPVHNMIHGQYNSTESQ